MRQVSVGPDAGVPGHDMHANFQAEIRSRDRCDKMQLCRPRQGRLEHQVLPKKYIPQF